MKSRRAFYKEHVAKSIRVMMALFIVSYFIMFGVVLYDSFHHHLPFHYILWFLVGLVISFLYRAIQKLHCYFFDHDGPLFWQGAYDGQTDRGNRLWKSFSS